MMKVGIFDIGGVLAFPDAFDDMVTGILAQIKIPENVFYHTWRANYEGFVTGTVTEEQFWQRLKHDTQKEIQLPEESVFLTEYKKRFKVSKDMVTLAHRVKQSGIPIAILSNIIKPHADFIRGTDLLDNFDFVYLSNEIGLKKPGQEVYDFVISELGVPAGETFFIDDKHINIDGANKVGIHGIQMTTADQMEEAIKELGVSI